MRQTVAAHKKSQRRESPILGHKVLDSQHELEMHIADRLERALLEGSCLTALSELFYELCAYVVLHFTTRCVRPRSLRLRLSCRWRPPERGYC